MTTNEQKIKEQDLDIAEVKTLLNQATRENVKTAIQSTLSAYEEELVRLQKAEKQRLERLQSKETIAFSKKIDSYGWDQSEKFVKIYITSLKDCSTIKESDIVSKFTQKSFDVTIKNLNVNYNLTINNLCFKINPDQSIVKLKKDMVAIWLRKDEAGKEWPGITEIELKVQEKKMDAQPKADPSADPQEGLMSMMKKMYDEGDDEMKRTISKSFMESREKSAKGGDEAGIGGMPGMGGMGGMPGMGGMGGMPGMGGMGGKGGAGGMPDLSSMMAGLGGGQAGGEGGMPDLSKMMAGLGGKGGGAGGMPDIASMMAAMGKQAPGADI